MKNVSQQIKNVIKSNEGTELYFALYPSNKGVTIEIRTLLEPQVTLFKLESIGLWKMRELILELIHSDFVSADEKDYLTYRADEIVFENYAYSTQKKWFEHEGQLHNPSYVEAVEEQLQEVM